jgi:protein-tyrosine-phosphatase
LFYYYPVLSYGRDFFGDLRELLNMPKVMFICTANLCRSPIAEVLFRQWLQRHSVAGDWQVFSCGTWAQDGTFVSAQVQHSMLDMGIDMTQHRSRSVTGELLAESDLVLCMTRSHREALHAEFPQFAGRIRMLSEMVGENFDVADVGELVSSGYVRVAKELTSIIENAGERVLNILQPASCSD